MAYTKEQVRAMLPQVGDKLIRRPVWSKHLGMSSLPPPLHCVVVYVNTEHMWYMVQFEAGYRQCYKVPEVMDNERG